MRRVGGSVGRATVVGATLLIGAGIVAAELADVYLKNGVRLRGDVTLAGDDIVLRNEAGEIRLPRTELDRVLFVGPPGQPATQPAPATQGAVQEEDVPGAEPGDESGEEYEEEEEDMSGVGKLIPAPLLSKADIQRLRLQELTLMGPAEPVRVRFLKKRGEPDVPEAVLEELRERQDFNEQWEQILTRGQPHEKLQLILRETGMKYADRIAITNDPEVFATFRRQVLPLINKSCARAGCHSGSTAQAYRFPTGPKSSEAYAYTVFVVLDELVSQHGPLINREHPEQSILLNYMLPQEVGEPGHPPTGRGRTFRAVISGKDDPAYAEVVNWIRFLLVPRTDYGLEYENPYAGQPVTSGHPAEQAEMPGPPPRAEEPRP